MLSPSAVLDSLIRAGMRHVSPRDTPLAYAVAAAEEAGALVALRALMSAWRRSGAAGYRPSFAAARKVGVSPRERLWVSICPP